jgi:hypothetical protein
MQHDSVAFPGPMRVVWNNSPLLGANIPFLHPAKQSTIAIVATSRVNFIRAFMGSFLSFFV